MAKPETKTASNSDFFIVDLAHLNFVAGAQNSLATR
jgi:hypothetical protein